MRPFRSPGQISGGRLLNEFLISLGLFFLILTADLVILNSASRSSSTAGATREALDLAREGLEEVVALPTPGAPMRREKTFSARGGSVEGFQFNRTVKVTPLSGDKQGLSAALVTVTWGGNRAVRLERYVPRL